MNVTWLWQVQNKSEKNPNFCAWWVFQSIHCESWEGAMCCGAAPALKDLVTKCRHCSRPVKRMDSFKAHLHMEKYWLSSYRISAFWMNLCLKWQTYYWSSVILYKCCLHCSYFDNEKRYLAAKILILPWRTGNNKSFLNYFNHWVKCFRIKKNVSLYVKNIANAHHFSKINIIVFLLFHRNSIKIILCNKAEIKQLIYAR